MADDNRKTLALISHDGKKADMVAFAMLHKDVLKRYDLVVTLLQVLLTSGMLALAVRLAERNE